MTHKLTPMHDDWGRPQPIADRQRAFVTFTFDGTGGAGDNYAASGIPIAQLARDQLGFRNITSVQLIGNRYNNTISVFPLSLTFFPFAGSMAFYEQGEDATVPPTILGVQVGVDDNWEFDLMITSAPSS